MEEDKLGVLNRIFGDDLTVSTIRTTLNDNNDDFEAAVEKLVTLPSNKPQQPQPQQAPLDAPAKENIQRLHHMFTDLTQSVITTVYETNKRDVEGTVDTLLNMTSNEVAGSRPAAVARQEAENQAYEEYKRLQQRLQEEEKKRTTEAQRVALQKVKEDEDKKKREEEEKKKQQDAYQTAFLEQERVLQEFQRKKAEEDQKKKSEEDKKKKVEDDKKKQVADQAVLEERKRFEAERKRVEEEKQRLEEEKARALQQQLQLQEKVKKLAEEEKKREEEKALMAQKLKEVEEEKKKRQEEEDRIMKKRFEEERAMLQDQRNRAEAERKILEERVKTEKAREEEERRRRFEEEKRFREEQDRIKRSWEEKVRQLEKEKEMEDRKRQDLKKAEDEERIQKEADMRKVLELERLKLDEQRRKVEEEKRVAEEKLKAMELAALQREAEEEQRRLEEETRRLEEEERARLKKEEEEQRARLQEEERLRVQEELKRKMAEDIAASAVLVAPTTGTPKIAIDATVEGNEISGSWELKDGTLPATQAWIGLFPRRSNNSYVGFQYVNGASGPFHFKALTPGHYEVRFFTNKPVSSRIAESLPLLVGPKVHSFVAQQQGDQLMLEYRFENSSPSTWDWVGIFERDQRRNKPYITSVYGNPTGSVAVALPRAPGIYQARLFAAGAKYNEQATVDFEVADNDCVMAPDTITVGNPIKANWVLRTVEPSTSDWIGLFATSETNNSKYLSSAYTNGTSFGEIAIPAPKEIASGTYELRLFSSRVGKYTIFKTSGAIYLA